MAPQVSVEATDDIQAFIMPDPLTIEGVAARRAKAPKLTAGLAATSDIPLFKGRDQHAHKPLAKKWDHRLNKESARKPSSIKAAAKFLGKPGILSLGGGLPSSTLFPFAEVSYKVPAVGKFTEKETAESGVTLTAGKYDMSEGKSLYDIHTAYNYSQSSGAPQLMRWMVEHTEIVHNPPYADWSSTMSVGSTSAWELAVRMFIHPNMYMIADDYMFSSVGEAAIAMGVRFVGIKTDDEGIIPESLDSMLTNWDSAARHGAPKPFLLYTVPTGENPTGATQSLQRRKAIYALAQKHDLYIVEDEPYYFLQMQPYTGQNAPDVPPPATHAEFIASLVPSYLSLDIDGRVMRLDSFSKVISPGARIGWVTACEQVVTRFKNHGDLSTQGPSGFSQLPLFKLLDEHWGHAGYLDWLIHIRMDYTKRRDVMLAGCEDYLPRDIASWKAPMAGMFHWIEIQWQKHPLADKMSVEDLEERIWLAAIENNSLLVRGSWFVRDEDIVQDKMFFRACFAAASAEDIREAIRRFGITLREEFKIAENGQSSERANGSAHV